MWDDRLADRRRPSWSTARRALLDDWPRSAEAAYRAAGGRATVATGVELRYEQSWEGPLRRRLGARRRADDLRRGATHRRPAPRRRAGRGSAGRDARVQASQGEQRCLALGLRLGVHHLLTARLGRPPLLLLDDVFSELDPARSRALRRAAPRADSRSCRRRLPCPTGMEVAKVIDVAELARDAEPAGRSRRRAAHAGCSESLDAVVRHHRAAERR